MIGIQKDLDGILLIDKPSDHTSHDVVARVRRKLGMKRIGHAGTLDPMATGLMIMLVGKATSASQYLISLDKEYAGTIRLGEVTNTQDAEGEVLERRPVPAYSQEEILAAVKTFLGDQYQMPPMFSAIKIDGVPLYKSARKGEDVEREPRFVRVMSWDITRFAPTELDFVLKCSKGTYVRTLANDLGAKLGCGAHLGALRRTATNAFHVSQALTIEQFEAMSRSEIESRLIPVRSAIPPGFVL
ncbi:MAG: tRNA pseudouridine(55) synthase TruB [Opitutaceae bacterium]|nr:tRNA pseudouridine(55) synthase TruB [Opitutaceae bacterium]